MALLAEYHHIFSNIDSEIGRTSMVKYKIQLKPNVKPVKQRLRGSSPQMDALVKKYLENLLEKDIIMKENSEWGSNIILVTRCLRFLPPPDR